ncbi:2-oxo acid dehydrogenase subunit E2 [Streptomyces wuyuanensis]|uniref:Dihydrolipoamide acetyltransferase component of pyruvate dehydrogenase complex n=1 Tax=Streptomyces wuyuanensis TaxID=1196353 RepID=A0A1G9YJ52_9ACTN|nr:2-oxo acid dehydrogenase subunit E2 [Streptomyces wuyuanensis]SDN08475.1 pyruvate dehydrogenase E2 component (dihydrolipoamide acetyltransferase) [Streptomyces wuyuanensis]
MGAFTMPSLGADMDEGTLQEWLVRPGEQVRKGEAVAVVETAKSTLEVECFETGTVEELLVEPGTTVPVGTALALIAPFARAREARGEPDETVEKTPPRPKPRRTAPSSGTEAARAPTPTPARAHGHSEAGPLLRHLAERSGLDWAALHGSGPGGRVTRGDVERAAGGAARPPRIRATPLARRLAAELHVDLGSLTGTGTDGAVRAADVRSAAPGGATTPTPAHRAARPRTAEDRAFAMRQAIAALMTRANRDIPHYYLSTNVDMAAAMDWLHEHNRRSPVGERLLPAALLLKAAACAAREVPELNGFWVDGGFVPGDGVHLGVAVSLRGGGLVAPALHDADTLDLRQLMAGLKDLVVRARTGRLRGSDVSAPTITVTNLGDQGVETVYGVIYPPQVALVGFGRIVDRPSAVDGLLGVRPVVTATLSADHRATDGAVGARYLTAVDRLLQNPEQL